MNTEAQIVVIEIVELLAKGYDRSKASPNDTARLNDRVAALTGYTSDAGVKSALRALIAIDDLPPALPEKLRASVATSL